MDIKALGYLGLKSPQARAWESFGSEIFVLALEEPGKNGTVDLHVDDRHHRIAVHPGEAYRLACGRRAARRRRHSDRPFAFGDLRA